MAFIAADTWFVVACYGRDTVSYQITVKVRELAYIDDFFSYSAVSSPSHRSASTLVDDFTTCSSAFSGVVLSSEYARSTACASSAFDVGNQEPDLEDIGSGNGKCATLRGIVFVRCSPRNPEWRGQCIIP